MILMSMCHRLCQVRVMSTWYWCQCVIVCVRFEWCLHGIDVNVSSFVSGSSDAYVVMMSTCHCLCQVRVMPTWYWRQCLIVCVRFEWCLHGIDVNVSLFVSGSSDAYMVLTSMSHCLCLVRVMPTWYWCQCVIVCVRFELRFAARRKWRKRKWRQPSAPRKSLSLLFFF